MILKGFLKVTVASVFKNWYALGHGVFLMTKGKHHSLTCRYLRMPEYILCCAGGMVCPQLLLTQLLVGFLFCLELQLFNFFSSSLKTLFQLCLKQEQVPNFSTAVDVVTS